MTRRRMAYVPKLVFSDTDATTVVDAMNLLNLDIRRDAPHGPENADSYERTGYPCWIIGESFIGDDIDTDAEGEG